MLFSNISSRNAKNFLGTQKFNDYRFRNFFCVGQVIV